MACHGVHGDDFPAKGKMGLDLLTHSQVIVIHFRDYNKNVLDGSEPPLKLQLHYCLAFRCKSHGSMCKIPLFWVTSVPVIWVETGPAVLARQCLWAVGPSIASWRWHVVLQAQ